jgi:hypothetical protein
MRVAVDIRLMFASLCQPGIQASSSPEPFPGGPYPLLFVLSFSKNAYQYENDRSHFGRPFASKTPALHVLMNATKFHKF